MLKKYQLGILGVNSKNLVYESFNLDKEITKVNPVKALTSGKITSAYIGKTVYLSNSASVCQEWRIADINHDGTTGTVDLVSKYNLQDGLAFSDSAHIALYSNMYYQNFSFRIYLNDTFYNGFAGEVRSSMKDISTAYGKYYYSGGSYYTNGGAGIQYINEKVKVPSITELGMTDENRPSKHFIEGSQYPIFTSTKEGTISQPYYVSDALLKNTNGSDVYAYWTRSIIPSYYSNAVDNPALVRRFDNGHAYIYYSGGSSSSSYDSYSVYSVNHGQGYIYDTNANKIYIGIMGIIRF